MGDVTKTVTVEFSITGLDPEQQQMIQAEVAAAITTGAKLLNVDAPNTMCGVQGKVASRLTCTIDPPLDIPIPGAIVSNGLIEAVVLERNAEEILVEVIEINEEGVQDDRGEEGGTLHTKLRRGERRWFAKSELKPTGVYYVANVPHDYHPGMGMVPGRMLKRAVPGAGQPLEMVAGFHGRLA